MQVFELRLTPRIARLINVLLELGRPADPDEYRRTCMTRYPDCTEDEMIVAVAAATDLDMCASARRRGRIH